MQDDCLCPECYGKAMRAKREAEKAAEAKKNAEAAAKCTLDLPELIGSEKQVKWALDIRTRLIADMSRRNAKWAALASGNYPEDHKSEIEAELAKLLNPSAKAWIDMRGTRVFGVYIEY